MDLKLVPGALVNLFCEDRATLEDSDEFVVLDARDAKLRHFVKNNTIGVVIGLIPEADCGVYFMVPQGFFRTCVERVQVLWSPETE